MFEHGLLNLTNWVANVILPTVAGLFAGAAIYTFSKARPYSHFSYAALASGFGSTGRIIGSKTR